MRYQWVMQQGGEDCAAASLAIVLKHYGRSVSINHIRELVGTDHGGTTLLGLRRGAEALGFATKVIKAGPEILDTLERLVLPAILYWKGYHFVVLYGRERKRFAISDPALGVRRLEREELLAGWQGGIMLVLQPQPAGFARQASPPSPPGHFAGLRQRLWEQRASLRKLLPLNLAIGLLALSAPLLLQYLTDQVVVERQAEQLSLVAAGVVLLMLANSGFMWLQSNLVAAFAERLQRSLKLDFARQVLHLPIGYHEARRSGTVIRRLADIEQINLITSQLVIELPIKAFIGLAALGVIFFYSHLLGLLAMTVAAGMVLVAWTLRPPIRDTTYRAFTAAGENAGLLAETFNGALTIKALAAAPPLWREYQSRADRESQLNLRSARIRILNTTLTDALGAVGTVLLLWLGSRLVFQDALSIGQLIAIYGLKESFLMAVSAFVRFLSDWTHIKAITGLLTDLMEQRLEHHSNGPRPQLRFSPQADLSLKRLSFGYPGRRPLLENLSITIPGGRTTALIGKSGCGKSTLAKLLAGLYPLRFGEICLGGQRIDDLPRDILREMLVLVPQETFFLHRSIIENCRLGAPEATEEQIRTACAVAGADQFIRELPQQYETVLGAVGANLSGGQRARLAIARALLKDAPVLILDESTANLDPETEADLLDRLVKHRQGKTTILISHRPEVIRRANWVIRLEDGRLQSQGSVEELSMAAASCRNSTPLTPCVARVGVA